MCAVGRFVIPKQPQLTGQDFCLSHCCPYPNGEDALSLVLAFLEWLPGVWKQCWVSAREAGGVDIRQSEIMPTDTYKLKVQKQSPSHELGALCSSGTALPRCGGHAGNINTREMETGRSAVQGHPWPHSKFKPARAKRIFCLKTKKLNNKTK